MNAQHPCVTHMPQMIAVNPLSGMLGLPAYSTNPGGIQKQDCDVSKLPGYEHLTGAGQTLPSNQLQQYMAFTNPNIQELNSLSNFTLAGFPAGIPLANPCLYPAPSTIPGLQHLTAGIPSPIFNSPLLNTKDFSGLPKYFNMFSKVSVLS